MKRNLLMTILLPIFSCYQQDRPIIEQAPIVATQNPWSSVGVIPLLVGYQRLNVEKNSFGEWLRSILLKKDKTVFLYNGRPKENQSAQFAVLDISVGNQNLQQCADAVMRLRAEYLFAMKRYKEIIFWDNNHTAYALGAECDRSHFQHYLDKVFSMCGTLSLEKQLKKEAASTDVQPGDVLIQGGSPGHAMLVMDMAINKDGKHICLLSQSYMPAQDIHIVLNPEDYSLNPWYALDDSRVITPEWIFPKGHFKAWP